MELRTKDLPGTGGLIKTVPEDFLVEELPAYPPSGEGDHTFLFIEKRGLTTEEALTRLATALGCARDQAGAAGWKDRQAVCRQWVSLPSVDPQRARALELDGGLDGICVLEAARHGNKLRTGHLVGNRFTITVRGATDGVARASAVLARLGEVGLPNYFGEQRFGRRGDNADRGRALLSGQLKGRIGKSERRLLVSAYQSRLFNRYLEARMREGLLDTALPGDILKKCDTGGLFTVNPDDPLALADAERRLQARAVVVTGPMFGHKMMAPPSGSVAFAREAALLESEGLTPGAFAAAGKLAEGTRRPLVVRLEGARVDAGPTPDVLVLQFSLPAGSYATVVLAEITKTEVT